MLATRLRNPLRSTLSSANPLGRTYASASSGGGSNLPLILGAAGLLGLGGYVYLQRNPEIFGKIDALKQDVKAKAEGLEAERKASSSENSLAALIKDSWVPFKLTRVEPYNHNTKIYTFDIGENKVAGGEVAYVVLVKPDGDEPKDDKGNPVIRPYTAISSSEDKGIIKLLIKEYKTGKLTPYIASLTPGQNLQFKGPIQKFKYEPNSIDRGLCIAGGSGITPMWQLITHSLKLPEDKTKWTLVFCNVEEKDILLRKEWDQLAKSHPDRLEVKYVLDKSPWGWKGETGFVTPSMISKLFPKGDDKVKVYVCGPPGQVKAVAGPKDGMKQGEVTGALKELGYTSEEVFKY